MSDFDDQELKKLAHALAALTPRPTSIDRDQLLFEAGRRSVTEPRLWRGTSLGMTLVAGFLVVILVLRPSPTPDRILPIVGGPSSAPAVSEGPSPVEPTASVPMTVDADALLPAGSYWRMQQAALRDGNESLPSMKPEAGLTPAWPSMPVPRVGSHGVIARNLYWGDE